MTKLVFNYETTGLSVISQLDSIVEKLNSFVSSINSNGDFQEAQLFNDLRSGVKNITVSINEIIENINRDNRTLENLIDSYNSRSKFLPNYVIEKRDSIIKI